MTLILNYSFDDVISVMTSDTRNVLKLGKSSVVLPDGNNKADKLTNFLMYAGGGNTILVEEIRNHLKKSVNETTDLEECVYHFEKVIDELGQDKQFRKALKKEEEIQICISGFTRNGQTGYIGFVPNEGISLKIDKPGGFSLTAIAPDAEKVQTIMAQFEFPDFESIYDFPSVVISYFARIQKGYFDISPKEVSETCNYTVLFKDPATGLISFLEGTLDISK